MDWDMPVQKKRKEKLVKLKKVDSLQKNTNKNYLTQRKIDTYPALKKKRKNYLKTIQINGKYIVKN